jgi:DNA-binding CsgD family transcriptional regulator
MTDTGNLTTREREIFSLAARGLSNAEIAREAFISEATVKTHMRRIMAKAGVTSRARLAAFAQTRARAVDSPRTNSMAIVAIIAALVVPLAGIICGHVALRQIKKSGESGRSIALWGTILGYCFSVLHLSLYVVAAVLYLPSLVTSGG